jgi:BirA family transcriptional regulator, biotin operon repressor / biotin---[acetyl-CoA-carboxylase] ligase
MKKKSNNINKLVQALNTHSHQDGTTLGEQLGISRAAIWKMVTYLKEEGIKIDSIKGKGYRLIDPLILLDQDYIQIEANLLNLDCNVSVFESIDSTNDFNYRLSVDKKFNVCISEKQTNGGGRFKRKWLSPYARNIYLSIKYTIDKDVSELSGLSLILGIGVVEALSDAIGLDGLQIKWPNDILFEDSKLCGISMDVRAEANALTEITIGIGINVNMLELEDINRKWTSIQEITGSYIDRNKIIIKILNRIIHLLNDYEHKGFQSFIKVFHHYDYLLNKKINLRSGKYEYAGIGCGINSLGHLLIKNKDGDVKSFSSADTTLAKK